MPVQMTAKAVYPEALPEVRERLGMTAESIRSDVAYLKMWMSTRPHFGKLTGGKFPSKGTVPNRITAMFSECLWEYVIRHIAPTCFQ